MRNDDTSSSVTRCSYRARWKHFRRRTSAANAQWLYSVKPSLRCLTLNTTWVTVPELSCCCCSFGWVFTGLFCMVPTVMESHGILASHGKWRESWKSHGILTICSRKKILELQKSTRQMENLAYGQKMQPKCAISGKNLKNFLRRGHSPSQTLPPSSKFQVPMWGRVASATP